jgi:hypothetical protein
LEQLVNDCLPGVNPKACGCITLTKASVNALDLDSDRHDPWGTHVKLSSAMALTPAAVVRTDQCNCESLRFDSDRHRPSGIDVKLSSK